MSSPREERAATVLTAAAAAAGAFWRLAWLSRQLPLDDEWHALYFVPGKSLARLWLTQGPGANSVPSNLWAGLLLRTAGWSETLLRLPSLLPGLAALVALPWLVRRLWGGRSAAVFAWLLALSPLAVFYGGLCRPYGAVLAFGAASVLCLLVWRREGGWAWGAAYAACGFVAVFHHPLAALPVFGALAAAAAGADPSRRRGYLLAGGVLAAACAAALGPAYASDPWFLRLTRTDRAGARTLLGLTMLWAGSASPVARALFAVAAGRGAARLASRDRGEALALAAVGALFALHLALTRQEGSHAAIQAARYGIALLPLLLALAAHGVADLPAPLTAGMVVLLAATGPLPRVYLSGTAFAHHSAFQTDYAPIDWSVSRERDLVPGLRMSASAVDPCYATLGDAVGVVEYPLVLGDHLDLGWYYEHRHGLPVKAGWRRGSFRPGPLGDGAVIGDMTADVVLSRVPADRLRFSTLVPLDEPAGLRSRLAGWAVVVHRDPLREAFPARFPDRGPSSGALGAAADLRAAFGAPSCEDPAVSVFRIR